MIRYHVKHSKKSRRTLRFLGLFLFLFGVLVVWLFFSGNAAGHLIGAILGALIGLYGGYLFIHSFELDKYDIDYEFRDDDFMIRTRYGEKVYTYDEITDLNQIIPENEMIYSIIQIVIGSKQYVLPFSYKKEVADKLYAFLNERVVTQTLDNSFNDEDGGEDTDDK